nr:hypothetical protein [Tanacetum cinerariifolium]
MAREAMAPVDVLVLEFGNLVADEISMGFGDSVSSNTKRDVAAKECLVTELGVTNRRKRQKEALLDRYRALGMNIDDATMTFNEQDLEEGESPEDVKAKCKHCGSLFRCHTVKHGNKNLKRHLPKCKPYLAKQSKDQTQIMFEQGDGNKMMAWKFNQKESKKALAHMVIVDELPFSFIQREGFRHYSKINQPLFDVPCRGTTTQDCYNLYEEEKNKLLNVIQKNIGRICLTTDSWTSLGKKSYMALIGHFIDNEWKLNKKVLNFCRLDGHSGVDIGKGVESCVNRWGINAIMAISVDNASANDSAIDLLRKTFANKDNCLLNGKWIHIRCTAHILNLVVQDGIKLFDKAIENIRYAVKWIKKSGSRIKKFKRCAKSAKCDSIKNLLLDVPTRWNSTYNMLEVAQAYEDGFDRYDLEDAAFGNVIRKKGFLVPTLKDWKKARKLCGFLKRFYEINLRISGTKYVTSHTLIVELSSIRELLKKQTFCDVLQVSPEDEILYRIAKVNSPRFPILCLMARDLLAIPVSTVAFESVFSTSGRVLDTFRSSLSDKSIESLICTQDWLCKDKDKFLEKEEDYETIIIDSSEDEGAISKRDINEDESFSY